MQLFNTSKKTNPANQRPLAFWSLPAAELLAQLQTTPQGITGDEARQRLARYGSNLLTPRKRSDALALLLAQFKSPITLILLFAAGLSFFLHEHVDVFIILAIVFVSGLLGFWQERGAANAVEKLLAIVQIKATVLRNGSPKEIPVEEIVPGDIIILNAGDIIPGDCLILESKDLFVDEATLTGETYPVEKSAGELVKETQLGQRGNTLFMGTHVISGSAKAVAVFTGTETEFGKVSLRLKLRPPETEFERGVRRFGYFLMEITMLLVISIFAINAYMARPVLEALLFSLALAVGLTPQLLPAIISVNLAHGAKRMALQKVIVKRLASIENFGSMNVLCSDKTGTLTGGMVQVNSTLDVEGKESEKILFYAYLNAFFETGFANPIDNAIRNYRQFKVPGYQKLDEVPYDFIRKRLSILVSKDDKHLMVTKGALQNVLAVCSSAETSDEMIVDIATVKEQIQQCFEKQSSKSFRILGVAYRDVGSDSLITKDHEAAMTFLGFLVLFDPPKPGIVDTINQLSHLGISLKIITGDNKLVAANVGKQVGLAGPSILTGQDLRQMSDEALLGRVNDINIFADIEPNQKERIILALKKTGNVVGYMGDGINDASALHVADVGISVDSAVDVAKDAADIVLLEKDLSVLVQGVREGRMTFANTLKYVFMATSANFGNMFSMAGVSLFLPFLPLLPGQILLTNLMTDIPEMTIATDSVDNEMVDHPRRWNIGFIRNFMLVFGILSSVFDYLTFGALLFILHAGMDQFRAGWFMESVISASMIVLVIRTKKPFFKSIPGKYLSTATLLIVVSAFLFPFIPIGKVFGFSQLPISFLLLMGVIVAFYIITAEMVKAVFYRRVKF
ncbi:MAG: magnesium-translocating P-type ATPase [Candidatus Methanoperedens sp.]|nr:magnesium-translocating P-type ATPase [Candidatus Methanoperedens sp.]